MKHLLEIKQLSLPQIQALLNQAIKFKQTFSNFQRPQPLDSFQASDFQKYIVANLFYENSTRTRISFEIAAKKLGMEVVNVDLQASSESKGETIQDTISNLAAMGISIFILRHQADKLIFELSKSVNSKIHLINAGSGQYAHPSQALLDLMTIYQCKPNLNTLKVAIVGDIKHSRVARSLQRIFSIVGIKQLTFISPAIWQPSDLYFGEVTTSLNEGLLNADVIICLRVQRERLNQDEHFDLDYYLQNYTLTEKSIQLAKPDAMIMHPGPINHGIEISSALVDSPQSYILEQVKNGVYMRMAILESLLKNAQKS